MAKALGIVPVNYEKIHPVNHGPKWETPAQAIVEEERTAIQSTNLILPTTMKIFSDGSLIDGQVGAAAFRMEGDAPVLARQKYLGTASHHTVYDAELRGIITALELACNLCPFPRAESSYIIKR